MYIDVFQLFNIFCICLLLKHLLNSHQQCFCIEIHNFFIQALVENICFVFKFLSLLMFECQSCLFEPLNIAFCFIVIQFVGFMHLVIQEGQKNDFENYFILGIFRLLDDLDKKGVSCFYFCLFDILNVFFKQLLPSVSDNFCNFITLLIKNTSHNFLNRTQLIILRKR